MLGIKESITKVVLEKVLSRSRMEMALRSVIDFDKYEPRLVVKMTLRELFKRARQFLKDLKI